MSVESTDRTARATPECVDENAILDFLHGGLTATARTVLEAHVDRCTPCRRVLSAIARVQTSPGGFEPAAAPPDAICDGFLPAGEVVDRYVIRGAIGAGGMGVVYAARDPQLERDVAIKMVRVAGVEDITAARRRLLHEARALARLSHPNVVAVYDTGTHGDDVFIALELLDGPNLREWLRAAPRRRADIVAVLLAAGRGLAAAHAAGIVHRDVKPDNIVIGSGGRVGVTDFGLAVSADAPAGDELATARVLAGTPAYMSPEQLWWRPAGPASDQFSFAVMAHEALFGVRPFGGSTLDERRRAACDPPAHPHGSPAARALCRALERALRSEPAARYPSLDALLVALERAAHRGRRRSRPARRALQRAMIVATGM